MRDPEDTHPETPLSKERAADILRDALELATVRGPALESSDEPVHFIDYGVRIHPDSLDRRR